MKKLFLAIGSMASVVAPIAAVVSCGTEKAKNVVKATEVNKNNGQDATQEVTQNQEQQGTTQGVMPTEKVISWYGTFDAEEWQRDHTPLLKTQIPHLKPHEDTIQKPEVE